jgi:hypothetical protein
MREIKRFNLTDKKQEPPFEYILLTGHCYCDYYLYKENEIEDAITQLKAEFSKGFTTARIYRKSFRNYNRTWATETFFSIDYCSGKLKYEDTHHIGLHVVFYISAGEWLNPRDLQNG